MMIIAGEATLKVVWKRCFSWSYVSWQYDWLLALYCRLSVRPSVSVCDGEYCGAQGRCRGQGLKVVPSRS